jgi:hypothetical protein
LKFWMYAYSVLTLNLTRDMGTSRKMLSYTWQRAALWWWVAWSAWSPRLPVPTAGEGFGTYPVPHCSTLVMLSWRRLFSHCTSSCLRADAVSVRVRGRVDRRPRGQAGIG